MLTGWARTPYALRVRHESCLSKWDSRTYWCPRIGHTFTHDSLVPAAQATNLRIKQEVTVTLF